MSVDNIAEAERILDVIVHVGTENRLEDEAHQRNRQTAADFPPGTTIYLTGDTRPWIVDQRWMNGNLALTHQPPASSNQLSDWMILHAHNIWRIDPTR